MGKTAPMKQKGVTSKHSRAVRRATSPSINTDKSLKTAQPPTSSSTHTTPYRPSILGVHASAGITKSSSSPASASKKSKSKNGRKASMSARAKRRHERGLDRAEAVVDKKEKKVERSRGRARTVQERARAWEELNRKIAERMVVEVEGGDDGELGRLVRERESWVDVEEGAGDGEESGGDEKVEEEVEVEMEVEAEMAGVEATDAPPVPQNIPLPEPTDEEDVIL